MSYADKILPSIWGRRFGLQNMTTVQSGGSRGPADFLVGPEYLRQGISTADSTSANLTAWGIAILVGTSVASTPVFTLDPPIPGVKKTIVFGSTDSALYLKMASGVSIWGSSLGSSAAALASSGGGSISLMGITTAAYAALGVSSTTVNTLRLLATT